MQQLTLELVAQVAVERANGTAQVASCTVEVKDRTLYRIVNQERR